MEDARHEKEVGFSSVSEKIFDTTNLLFCIILVPLLAISLSRSFYSGFRSIYYLHIIEVSFFWFIYGLRRQISFRFKILIINLSMISVVISGAWTFGLSSRWDYFVILTCLVFGLFNSRKTAIAYLIGLISYVVLVAVIKLESQFSGATNEIISSEAFIQWLYVIITLTIASIVTVYLSSSYRRFFKQMIEELLVSKRQTEQSEMKVKRLAELSFEGIAIHNHGSIQDCNSALAEMFGIAKEKLIGVNIAEDLIHEKSQAQVINHLRKPSTSTLSTFGVRANGAHFPIEIEEKALEDESEARVVAIRDITQRVKNMERIKVLSTVVEQSATTIIITNIDQKIEYVNNKFLELTGYTKNEIYGKDPRILSAGKTPRNVYKNMWSTLKQGKTWKGELLNKTKKGDFFWESVSIAPVKNEFGEITYYMATMEDITAQKKIQQKLKQAINKAEESDRLKSEFFHNMSHEIRTPLNGILGFSNLLEDSGLDYNQRKEYIRVIKESGDQLLKIINDILEISKLETKQVSPNWKEVCLNEELYNLVMDFNELAIENETPIGLKKGLPDDDCRILTDIGMLRKIIGNLLDNAIKFTEDGYIEVAYTIEEGELVILVKDTGKGIGEQLHGQIFERFSQAEKELTEKVGGLGLGLSIAQENAQLLGGKISVESKENEGSTFYLRIPFRRLNTQANLLKDDFLKSKKSPQEKGHFDILVAEDEEMNLLYIETLLQNFLDDRYILHHAPNGKKAVEIVAQDPNIDFVFMDIKMPIMNGFEATNRIKNMRPDLPVVIQTAYSTEEDIEKIKLSGCDDFICKPIDMDQFLSIINVYFPTMVTAE